MSKKRSQFEIIITHDAESDLELIHDFLATQFDPKYANTTLDEISKAVSTLSTFPDRGSHPKELIELGIRDFRQLISNRFRIIYRVLDSKDVINLIADGRQDMQALLARRVLRAYTNDLN